MDIVYSPRRSGMIHLAHVCYEGPSNFHKLIPPLHLICKNNVIGSNQKTHRMHIPVHQAQAALAAANHPFVELFKHGSLSVELYRPHRVDLQQPHTRDEVYVIVSGRGRFICREEVVDFQPGDFLFVPAFAPHRFIEFSDDFATWVLFYGPEGGE